MCSVPGVPTPGSEVSVVITRVNLNQNCGLVELWVNLNKEIKHVYEQMREEIQTPKRGFCGPEGKKGDLCLVNVDEKWHRARIVSVQEENCQVFLIDQGQPHCTVSDKLAWGKDECFILPPEIECCVLANILATENNWPERATNFLKSLPGKEFQGLVQHALMPDRTILLDLPIISKHLCKEGVARKIPVGEFKNLVLKCLNLPEQNTTEMITKEQSLSASNQLENDNHYFYPELMTNTLESVRVTEVIDPGNIFCELAIYSKAVKILTEQMNQELKGKASADESQPQTFGMPCAALGMDGKWRRAILKRQITSKDATVEVFFVDEGKTELVQVSNVKSLDRKFLRMPVATYNCKLEGVKRDRQWEQKELDYLKSIILNQNIVARFDCHILPEDQYSVSLFSPNAACINDYFLEKKAEEIKNDARTNFPHKLFLNCSAASPSNFLNSEQNSFVQSYNSAFSPMEMPLCDLLTVGASVGVKISCIDSTSKFWCQTSQCDKKLSILMKDLQAYYASVHPKPLVESVCVARNPDDNMWYRAKIIANRQPPDVEVRFIDFGQTKKIPLQELRPIDPTFLRLDAQAFQCSLFNVPPTDINFANEEFHKFVGQNSGLKCVVKEVASDEEGMLLNVVDLQTQSESASRVLYEKLAARPVVFKRSDHKIELNSKETICISCSETVQNFYCQLYRNLKLFQQVQSDIEKSVSNSAYSDYSFALKDLCIARYSYFKWQRGQVVEISPDLKVHFVDFGKTHVINKTDIRPFPREASAARTVPILAVPLTLFDVPEEIPQEINEWFAKQVVGKRLTMSVLGKGPNGKLMVELFDDLKSLNVQVREKIVNIAQAGKQLCNGTKTSPVSNGTEEEMDASDCDVLQKSPTKQSEQLKIADESSLPSQNAVNDSTAKKTEMNDQGKTTSTPNQTPTLPEKVPTYKKPIISFEPQVLHASSISGPDYFWCQCSNTDDLNKITKLAQTEGQFPQDRFFSHTLPCFCPCLALYKKDKQWYRAQVVDKDRNGRKLTVVFVDYGNEEDIEYKDLRPISPGLLEIAPQAFLCRLEVMEEELEEFEEVLDDEFYDRFYDFLDGKPLHVKVLRMGKNVKIKLPQYTVQIDDVGLHKHLDLYGLTVGESPPISLEKEVRQVYRHSAFKNILYSNPNALLNKSLPAFVTFNTGPAHFWCQLCDSDKLDEIDKMAQKAGGAKDNFFADASFTESLCPESPCLAYNSNDDKWYRAHVVGREYATIKVVYVDYGNEEKVDESNIMQIPQSLMMNQPQAFLCRLEHFDENAGVWDDKLKDVFYKVMADKLFDLLAVSVEHNEELKVPQYTIQLDAGYVERLKQKFCKQSDESTVASASDTSIEDATQTMSSAVPVDRCKFRKPHLDQDKTVVAYASYICAPTYFWCQFADSVQLDEVQKLTKREGQISPDMNFSNNLVPGDPCIALYSKDCGWYRAQILSKTEDKFSVVLIDYGYEDNVLIENVRPISQSLLSVPPRAFLCSLDGFKLSQGKWDDKAYDYAEDLLFDHLLKVTPVCKRFSRKNQLHRFIVNIECGSTLVNEAMKKHWKECSDVDNASTQPNENKQEDSKSSTQADAKSSKRVAYKNPNVSPNKKELVYASCIVDPHFFWCELASRAEKDRVKRLAQEAGQSQPCPTTLNKGDSCLALFSDDNRWYRALVGEKKGEKFNVVFIDYGNETDDVTIRETRILPQNLLDEPPQAFLCTLHGFEKSQGTWDDTVYDDFYNMILNKCLEVKIQTMEENADWEIPQYSVQVEIMGGSDVNVQMEKYWKRSADQTAKDNESERCQDVQPAAAMMETE